MNTAHTHEEIAPLANALWEMEGRPDGKADEHWRAAEAHLKFNRQADVVGEDHKLFTGDSPAATPEILKSYRVVTTRSEPEIIEAVSVDDSDPVTVRFTRPDGSVREFGRGVFISYEELVTDSPIATKH